jgi:hypothetical protein
VRERLRCQHEHRHLRRLLYTLCSASELDRDMRRYELRICVQFRLSRVRWNVREQYERQQLR